MKNSHDDSDSKSNFWKKTENVPGRPVSSTIHNLHLIRDSKSVSPKKNVSKSKHRKTSSSSSFQEFQESTDDAWDVGDDDICLSTEIPIHPKVAQSTAMEVLSIHSKGTFSFTNDDANCILNANDAKVGSSQRICRQANINFQDDKPCSVRRLETQKDGDSFTEHQSNFVNHSNHPIGPGIGIRQTRNKQPSLFNPQNLPKDGAVSKRDAARLQAFQKLLESPNVDLKELQTTSWSGIPSKVRPMTWKLLSGYLPTCKERRESFLQRRKEGYQAFVSRYYDSRTEDVHHETYRQIHIDVPRMSPLVPLFQQEIVQEAFERVLYILAIRHPASGYVQGMNDLLTPFYVVFLQDYIPPGSDVESYDVSKLSRDALLQVETDSYFCMEKLMDGIQNNYTFAQPGIQHKVYLLKELMKRIDAPLHAHLEHHSIEYLQFSFRWMNNLLMRELPLSCTIRLWDTYLSEPNGFSRFHLYVCAAFLQHWSNSLLQEKDFQGLMIKLQNLPTSHWTDKEIDVLLADAYRLKYMFDDAPNHLQSKEN
ncbi:TBC1 domain family member 22B-like [Uloborus diversus]|uniref:TBC1 domain family member 22B-like n=1 Tax=Uloborus diversus TaxID=327109 RepID=UPI00240951D3|nr:TBC1 domain family member 22B-like [Uloborus diversus]